MITHKQIVLGVTGSIAAYKSADLVRRLRDHGAQVRVVMTTAATSFITPLTLQALSGQAVHTQLLDAHAEAAMNHIELARWAELILIAPASANFLARLTYGHADDLLTTLCLVTTAPIIVAPAMNQQMWQAPITQENCQRLQQRGITFLGPAHGAQACGETGAGRMLAPLELLQALENRYAPGPLTGHQVLITAGPTREPIDPVRFISNRSSGRMGYALAHAAQALGAQVTLISGPVALTPPAKVNTHSVSSAQEMFEAVMAHVSASNIFIATAAVADYRPQHPTRKKLKKQAHPLSLPLEPTVDILAQVANQAQPPFTVGFAAETEQLAHYAEDKLHRKKLNMIAANRVDIEGIGFDSEENALTVFWAEGSISLPKTSKSALAHQLMALIVEHYFKYQG